MAMSFLPAASILPGVLLSTTLHVGTAVVGTRLVTGLPWRPAIRRSSELWPYLPQARYSPEAPLTSLVISLWTNSGDGTVTLGRRSAPALRKARLKAIRLTAS